jgi:hypothetical protein
MPGKDGFVMGDLQINGTVMGDLRKTFSTIADRMDGVSRAMGNANGESVGAPKLIDDVHDFADDWHYGIKQIGQHADNAVHMMTAATGRARPPRPSSPTSTTTSPR